MLRGETVLIFLLIILINISFVSASVVINEVMYNPEGEDNNYEWLELYNSGDDINLTGWILKDEGSANTSLTSADILQSNSYLIIADNTINFNSIYNCSCNVIEGNLGLNNGGDEITLWNNTGLVDYIDYNDIVDEGYSLQLVSGEWCAGLPTAGTENSCQENETEQDGEQNQTQNQTTESSLYILDWPQEIEFGELVKIEINAYRGNTAKYAVYLWIEDKEEERITEKSIVYLYDKFTNLSAKIPIQLNPNCNNEHEEGNYTLVLEGLDKIAKENVTLLLAYDDFCITTQSTSDLEIEYGIDRPSNAIINKEFSINLLIKNNQKKHQEFDVWSGVYQGSKCYSNQGNEQANLQHITVSKNSEESIQLKNVVEEAEEGTYKLKIIIKQGEKEKEFINDIILEKSKEEKINDMLGERENISNQEQLSNQEENQQSSDITGKAIFLSKAEQIKNNASWIFAILCLLIASYFIIKGREVRS